MVFGKLRNNFMLSVEYCFGILFGEKFTSWFISPILSTSCSLFLHMLLRLKLEHRPNLVDFLLEGGVEF